MVTPQIIWALENLQSCFTFASKVWLRIDSKANYKTEKYIIRPFGLFFVILQSEPGWLYGFSISSNFCQIQNPKPIFCKKAPY